MRRFFLLSLISLAANTRAMNTHLVSLEDFKRVEESIQNNTLHLTLLTCPALIRRPNQQLFDAIGNSCTLLHFAVKHKSLQSITYLVEEVKANVDSVDSKDLTPLWKAVDNDNPSPEIVKYLLTKNAESNAIRHDIMPNKEGWTPLTFVVDRINKTNKDGNEFKNLKLIIKSLLDHDALINESNYHCFATPLSKASNQEIKELLVSRIKQRKNDPTWREKYPYKL